MSDTSPAPAAQPEPSTPGGTSRGLTSGRIHASRPALLADARGFTAPGGGLLVLLASALGAAVDALAGIHHHRAFTLMLALSAALAAWKVHREDLFAAVCIPPLVYVASTVVGGVFVDQSGGIASREALQLLFALAIDAPQLLIASALTIIVVILRWTASRR